MEAGRFLDNKIKKSLYKKILNSCLIIIVLSIDDIGTFKTYKTRLTAINNHIIRYNINHKGFPFEILLKSETMSLIIELVKKDIIDWEVAVIIL